MRRNLGSDRLRRLRVAAGRNIAIRSAIAAGPAAALAADVFNNALVAALLDCGCSFLWCHSLKNFAAARLVDLLMIGVAVAIGDTFGPDALAVARHTDVAALARVLDLGNLSDHRHKPADLRDFVAAAMRAASGVLSHCAAGQERGQKEDGQ